MMDAQRSWLGSLGATFVKMSSPLTLDKPLLVDQLDVLLKRELYDCIIDEGHTTSTSPLLKILPKVKLSLSAIQNLHITTPDGPVYLYKKGRWNICHFDNPDEVENSPPLLDSKFNSKQHLQATSSEDGLPEVALDQEIEAAWAGDSEDSPPCSDSETEAEDGNDSDDRVKDPDYIPSASASEASDYHPSHSATAEPVPSEKKKNVSSERQYARFLNALVSVLHNHVADPVQSYPIINGFRAFSAAFSTRPIFHALGPRKPDIVIIESKMERLLDDISWDDPKLIMELTEEDYTPTSRIALTLHSKAYLVLRSQPWRRFVLGFSVAHDLMRLHYYDRSGAIVSRPIDIHNEPRKFVRAIAAAALADRSHIGFDPTIEISPPRSVEQPETLSTPASDTQHSLTSDPPSAPVSDAQHTVPSDPPPLAR